MSQPPPTNPENIQYHIMGADGREYGPVDALGLQTWVSQGQVNAQTQVRRAHEPQWQPAMAMPDLQPLLGTAGGPPMAGPMMQQAPVDPAKEAMARKLVNTSHIMGYGGLALLIGGPIIGGVLGSGMIAGVSAVGGYWLRHHWSHHRPSGARHAGSSYLGGQVLARHLLRLRDLFGGHTARSMAFVFLGNLQAVR